MAYDRLDNKDKVGIAAPIFYSLSFVAAAYTILSGLEGEGGWALLGLVLAVVFAIAGYFSSSYWRNRSEERRRAFEERARVAGTRTRAPAESGGSEPLPPRDVQEREAREAYGEEQRP